MLIVKVMIINSVAMVIILGLLGDKCRVAR